MAASLESSTVTSHFGDQLQLIAQNRRRLEIGNRRTIPLRRPLRSTCNDASIVKIFCACDIVAGASRSTPTRFSRGKSEPARFNCNVACALRSSDLSGEGLSLCLHRRLHPLDVKAFWMRPAMSFGTSVALRGTQTKVCATEMGNPGKEAASKFRYRGFSS